ncbi:MAG TPA: acyl-CoA thioesterase [Candidatus Methanoperedens sp.]|nr:acyl-CoA thioesterase [Candidatus Methanoperedens sp.]
MSGEGNQPAHRAAREPIHRHAIVVREDALDENGHVNNVRFVQWMQDAAMEHSDRGGCSRLTKENGAIWVARSHAIEYLRPAFLDDRITVLTWVCNLRRVRSLRKYRFFRDADGALLARGETNWVFVDMQSGRPRNIPDAVAQTFALVPPEREPPSGGAAAVAERRCVLQS